MKFKSQVYTAVSGSIGGIVYAHNSAGMYTRGRGTPTNPNTAAQQDVRDGMGELAARWASLTQGARDTWADFATAHPITNKFGDPLTLSGQQMYNRLNLPRLQAGVTRIDNAAAIVTTGVYTPPVLQSATNPDDVQFGITNTNAWATAVGGACLVYISPVLNLTKNFFKGPFTLLGVVLGAATPPAANQTLTAPITWAIGKCIFVRFRITDPTGWLHEPSIQGIVTD